MQVRHLMMRKWNYTMTEKKLHIMVVKLDKFDFILLDNMLFYRSFGLKISFDK